MAQDGYSRFNLLIKKGDNFSYSHSDDFTKLLPELKKNRADEIYFMKTLNSIASILKMMN